MRVLTVLYDGRCELCGRARAWLEKQPKYVHMAYVPATSPEARTLFPALDHEGTLAALTVVADDGRYWRGAKAWVTLLWALREYRGWAFALAREGRFEHAERLVDMISRNRQRVGWLGRLLGES